MRFNLKIILIYNNKLATFNHDEPNVIAAIYLKNLNTDSILDTLITLPGDDSLYEMPYDASSKNKCIFVSHIKNIPISNYNDTTLFKVNKEQDFSTFEDASFNNPDNNFLVDENNELVQLWRFSNICKNSISSMKIVT